MASPRYTILIANQKTGAVRRLSVVRWAGVAIMASVVSIPFLIGLGMSNPDPIQLQSLKQTNDNLRQENASYRAATGELANQISSLQSVLNDLDTHGELDPTAKAALQKLPAV